MQYRLPLASVVAVNDYPRPPVDAGRIAPVPKRIRARIDDEYVVDTTRAKYVWEHPAFPAYYVPLADVATELVSEGALIKSDLEALGAMVKLEWDAADAWYEEDEEVFVHPRNPYARIDAQRSSRTVKVELDGITLAESSAPVILFETGLPPRFYLPSTDVRFEHLSPSDTVTSCPYKGTTSRYWSAQTGGEQHDDIAWAYDFPTRESLPIAGLIAFYNERVDITLDGEAQTRPTTSFS